MNAKRAAARAPMTGRQKNFDEFMNVSDNGGRKGLTSMERHGNALAVISALAGGLLVIAVLLIVAGWIANGYNLIPIGIAMAAGAGFMVLIGLFLFMVAKHLLKTKSGS